MELRVLDSSFVALDIVDSVDSILWTERYYGYGSFEIYVNFSYALYDLFREDRFLINSDSDRIMVIETVKIHTDPEKGNKLVIEGRSLESLLDRRIILRQTIIDSSFQSGIQTLLNQNVINGIYPERNIPNFIFSTSSDPAITTPTMTTQYYADNLYEAIKTACEQEQIGFRVLLNSSNQFVFSLYAGSDRSYAQSTNPYVVFSPDFDNLIKSEYYRSKKYKKNYVLIDGLPTPGSGTSLPERTQAWTDDVGTGLTRREMYLDASDLPRIDETTEVVIPVLTYLEQLKQRGLQELALYGELTIFEGEVDLSNSFVYRTDFFLGDIIQMVDDYGNSARAQILEMTFSEGPSGRNIVPTLKTV